jgi:hypothetical protein
MGVAATRQGQAGCSGDLLPYLDIRMLKTQRRVFGV